MAEQPINIEYMEMVESADGIKIRIRTRTIRTITTTTTKTNIYKSADGI